MGVMQIAPQFLPIAFLTVRRGKEHWGCERGPGVGWGGGGGWGAAIRLSFENSAMTTEKGHRRLGYYVSHPDCLFRGVCRCCLAALHDVHQPDL